MVADRNCDVVVVGGGVAGGGLANHLGKAGLDVVLVEAKQVIPVINRGDQISPPSVMMLDQVGALPDFWDLGATKIRHWRAVGPEGETISELHFGDFLDEPYDYILSLHHPKIHQALLTSADRHDNVEIIRGFRMSQLLRDDAGGVVGVRGRHGGQTVEIGARIVAGCDGPLSTVRQEAGIQTDLYEHPYHYLMLTCSRSGKQPADWNDEFWTSSGFVGMYPISGGNIRCPVEAEHGAMARWKQEGLASLQSEVSDWLPEWFSGVWNEMTVLDDDLHFYKVTTHHAASYVGDGVMLLGDAAHTTPPYLGMGMNMGFRDGVFASKTIVEALSDGSTDATTLKAYEHRVREFNQWVIHASENYGSVAAAEYRTHDEVERALEESSALDSNVLGRIYEPYE